ncbi:hypothetical protein EYF80_034684 [Liparis tanakae]|uniref:Uncharacterized protein n=1 Tax=Liparis tanakae TaxID=230148 RepID=A0A4Z2GPE7_9TELE|nr:hypothetical protein EYF80_034684 [Liparis tanakae]
MEKMLFSILKFWKGAELFNSTLMPSVTLVFSRPEILSGRRGPGSGPGGLPRRLVSGGDLASARERDNGPGSL